MGHTVRSHTRKTASGGTTTVRNHSKSGPPGRGRQAKASTGRARAATVGLAALAPPKQRRKSKKKTKKQRPSLGRRGWNNIKRSWRAARRHKKWAAVGFAGLAAVQIGSWVGLNSLAATAATVGVAALGTAYVARVLANTGSKKRR